MKRLLNVLLISSITVFLYFCYFGMFEKPVEPSDIAALQIRMGLSALFMVLIIVLRTNIKFGK
ncbi:hypothetical protein [Paenibacillus sp. Z6-24]